MSDSMPSTFARDEPLQASKLAAVVGALGFGIAAVVGLVPGQQLGGLLYLAFFPMLLAAVVGVEALLAAIRLRQRDDPVARLTARPGYTAIRTVEVVVTVLAPVLFYVLIVRLGGDAAGPGAVGLLFVGLALGLGAYAAVLLRTLTEYYHHRRRTAAVAGESDGSVAE